MTTKYEPILSTDNLVALGIYKDTVELYDSIKEAFNVAYEAHINKPIPDRLKDGKDFCSHIWCSGLFNNFFRKNSKPFSERTLYANREKLNTPKILRVFTAYINKESGLCDYSFISFEDFLKELERLIITIENHADTEAGNKTSLNHTRQKIKTKVEQYIEHTTKKFPQNKIEHINEFTQAPPRCPFCATMLEESNSVELDSKQISYIRVSKAICDYCEIDFNSAENRQGNSKDSPTHSLIEDGESCPVIVCKTTQSYCKYKGCMTEMRNVIVARLEAETSATIVAEYCFDCNKYRIDETQLKNYERKYGKLIFLREEEKPDNSGKVSNKKFEWDKSALSRYGYCVGKTGLSTSHRQKLLSYLIDNSLMTVENVFYTLRQANDIERNMHYDKRQHCIEERDADIEFLSKKYLSDKPPKRGRLEQN